MPISSDEFSDFPEPPTDSNPGSAKPDIIEWVDELPRTRRTTEFDPVIDKIRANGVPGKWAVLGQGDKPITANKISSLKKRYADIDFRQVGGQTYATIKES